MRAVALTKTWRGEELLDAAIESIYPVVDKIVFVHSDVSWRGERGNTVRSTLDRWARARDRDAKVVSLELDTTSQDQQYEAGRRWCERHLDYDYLMLWDTDEAYFTDELRAGMDWVDNNPGANAYSCSMYSYVRSPFFRVSQIDGCHPVIFVKRGISISGPRGCGVWPRKEIPGCTMHHFTGIRKNLELVIEKHATSSHVEHEPLHDVEMWVQHGWNRLPYARNFHPNSRYSAAWPSCTVVTMDDLPPTMRDKPLVQAYRDYDYTLAIGRTLVPKDNPYRLPMDFGPGHPDWKVPSKRNAYNKLMQETGYGETAG